MDKERDSTKTLTRKKFIKKSVATAGVFMLPRFSIGKPGPSANSKLNIAVIGTAGVAHQSFTGTRGENIVALVDVDSNNFAAYAGKYPEMEKAQTFEDFRIMFDKWGARLDGVCVNTPDHTHFAATMEALERKIHVATQKPLTHNIWEARTLRKAARKYGVTTVMGNQGHTFNGIREFKEWYDAGIFGDITEAHSWTGGPGWGNKFFGKPDVFPPPRDPVPASLNYDLWLGPAKKVPFHNNYHPRRWRGFHPFGSGQLADWFCHVADAPVWTLDLYEPSVIEAVEVEGGNEWMTPDGNIIRYQFPARGKLPPCTLTWGNGSKDCALDHKPQGVEWGYGEKLPGGGTYYRGTKENAYTDHRSNNPRLANRDRMKAFKDAGYPEQKFQRVEGGPYAEWVRAIKGEGPEPGSNFDYGARLTEVGCLGVLAARFGGRIEWDSKNMKATNRPELEEYIKEPVRKGWEYGENLWT
jgi:predicted dehydrogenase